MTRDEAKRHIQAARLMMLGKDNQPVSDLYYALNEAMDALDYDDARYHEEHGEVVIADVVWEDAVQALITIRHLKDRPCEACEYHSDRGCSKWDCVFDKVL